jgi:hypothetical protein
MRCSISPKARDLRSISDHLETGWFTAGTFVIEQGEAATTLYLVLSGEAEAVREHDDGSTEILARLEPGQFFGEMGIAAGKPRNAHVIARTDPTCLEFSSPEPAPYLGRGAGADLTGLVPDLQFGQEELGQATTRIDVAAVIDRKIAAIAAYRSQFAFQPDLIPTSLLLDLFGVEYFVRAHPPRALERKSHKRPRQVRSQLPAAVFAGNRALLPRHLSQFLRRVDGGRGSRHHTSTAATGLSGSRYGVGVAMAGAGTSFGVPYSSQVQTVPSALSATLPSTCMSMATMSLRPSAWARDSGSTAGILAPQVQTVPSAATAPLSRLPPAMATI